jgi:hypothetical protein
MSGEAPNGRRRDEYHTSIPAEQSVSVAVVEALAAVNGCDPTEMDPIGETVDLESVAELLRSSSSSFRLDFTVGGFEVTVYSDRSMTVVPA